MSGSLTHAPENIIRYLLIDLGVGTLPSAAGGWPVFDYQEPDIPDDCITVYGTGRKLRSRSQIDGAVVERYTFQIRVRSANPTDGSVKVRAIAIALDTSVYQDTVVISTSQYLIQAVSRSSGPLSLGKTRGSKRNLFTINADASLRQTV